MRGPSVRDVDRLALHDRLSGLLSPPRGQLVYPSIETSRSSCTSTSSPQSVGGPRAGDTGGGSSGSPRCVRIFRIGPGQSTSREEAEAIAAAARTAVPRRPAAPNAAAPRRRRSTKSCRSASRAGSRIARPASSPSRATSKRSSAAISPAGCSASHSPAPSAHSARAGSSSRSRASAGACARPATAGTWRRRPRTSSTTYPRR